MKNKMYLVTGAAGFLGGEVCRQLIRRGEKVRAFVLKDDPAAKYVPKEEELIEGDLCDQESLERFRSCRKGNRSKRLLILMKEKCLDVIASLKQSQHNLF